MSSLLYIFNSVFGPSARRETSVEEIIAPMRAIVSKLESYAEDQSQRSKADENAAEELVSLALSQAAVLNANARVQSNNANNARSMADRYSALTTLPTAPVELSIAAE